MSADGRAGRRAARAGEVLAKLAQHAPITMQVGKQAIARLLAAVAVEDEDLVRRAYGSEDFREGVAALHRKAPAGLEGPLKAAAAGVFREVLAAVSGGRDRIVMAARYVEVRAIGGFPAFRRRIH